MKILKLIGVLIDYPQDALWEHRQELLDAADHPALRRARRERLRAFIDRLLDSDPMTAQSAWLALFDRGRNMSLLLFEHIHGESRDRGQAMVDLMAAYERNGFELSSRELPDYLPLLLEYLSHRPVTEVHEWLHHIHHILGLLAARAAERESPYSLLFQLLVELSEGKLDLEVLRRHASQEPRDDTVEAMDRIWEEEAVRFSAEAPDENSSCSTSAATRRGATR
ncbi:MAG: nitrate reductase molybdenum cofactor assembly chaperone [Xanthomonadaceae bacterium]|jgi:nitrate reductase delta subunit|nr:nitrate reductase molybdenum cofactor assembly chaperone [Xanthomonadaceae bacterium]